MATKRATKLRPCGVRITAVDPIVFAGIPSITVTPPDPLIVKKAPHESAVVVTAPKVVATQIAVGTAALAGSNMGFKAVGRAYEGQNITTLARIMLPTGGQLTQGLVTGDASGTSIKLNVYNISETEAQVGTEADLTCSAVVYDTFQLDSGWSVDDVGYNFKHTYTGTSLDKSGAKVRLEYYVPTDEGALYVVSEINLDRAFK